MMALPCFVIGLTPTYAEVGYAAPALLLVLRMIQGAAVGGEVPSAWVFVAEHAPPGHRGLNLGILQAGLTLGYLLAAPRNNSFGCSHHKRSYLMSGAFLLSWVECLGLSVCGYANGLMKHRFSRRWRRNVKNGRRHR